MRKVLVLTRTWERVNGKADNKYPAVCASIRKHYADVAYHIFCTYMYVRGVSIKKVLYTRTLRTCVQKHTYVTSYWILIILKLIFNLSKSLIIYLLKLLITLLRYNRRNPSWKNKHFYNNFFLSPFITYKNEFFFTILDFKV